MAVYGRDIWDPLLIILQICALQVCLGEMDSDGL